MVSRDVAYGELACDVDLPVTLAPDVRGELGQDSRSYRRPAQTHRLNLFAAGVWQLRRWWRGRRMSEQPRTSLDVNLLVPRDFDTDSPAERLSDAVTGAGVTGRVECNTRPRSRRSPGEDTLVP